MWMRTNWNTELPIKWLSREVFGSNFTRWKFPHRIWSKDKVLCTFPMLWMVGMGRQVNWFANIVNTDVRSLHTIPLNDKKRYEIQSRQYPQNKCVFRFHWNTIQQSIKFFSLKFKFGFDYNRSSLVNTQDVRSDRQVIEKHTLLDRNQHEN